MSTKSLAEKAADLVARTHKLKDPLVVDTGKATDPKTGKPIYRFRVVSAAEANGPAYPVILTEQAEVVEASPALDKLLDRTALATGAVPAGAAPITISPSTNILTLNPGDTLDETITVTVPKNGGPPRADIYFLADTT